MVAARQCRIGKREAKRADVPYQAGWGRKVGGIIGTYEKKCLYESE